jgi:hypothetical protein
VGGEEGQKRKREKKAHWARGTKRWGWRWGQRGWGEREETREKRREKIRGKTERRQRLGWILRSV